MGAIIDLVKKFGIRKVLQAMADYLDESKEHRDRQLARDLRDAVRRYENDKKD